MEILRQELIETQKVRSELIKWKLLLVSALGAAGLGFAKTDSKINAEVLLCCIPLVCAYVDVQYDNLLLRIRGIATFLREIGPKIGVAPGLVEYEKFMASARKDIRVRNRVLGRRSFADWLVQASTFVFSGLVAVYAAGSVALRRPGPNSLLAVVMFLAGMGGVVFHFWLNRHTKKRLETLQDSGKKYAAKINADDVTK
ncbi:MAG: hypothetical protein JSU94_21160 [Phycisphaerales bacterium]|nr:MAG: hypothetical protein JSU94_21160 [Phycisphaerales bacterium]